MFLTGLTRGRSWREHHHASGSLSARWGPGPLRPELARTADDIERLHQAGRIASLIGVEGGHMIENSSAAIRIFHELGARYLTLTHWDNVEWADAATDRADHIDHIRLVAGIDHIGIGSDFFDAGNASMARGLGDVARFPYLVAELLRRGYSDEDVLKIAGRNHLRAMRQMERVAAALQGSEPPMITDGLARK